MNDDSRIPTNEQPRTTQDAFADLNAALRNLGHEIAAVVRETLVPPVHALAAEVDKLLRKEADRE